MSAIKEFKEFAIKGNLVDMAVAFVMGAAFGKVVSSFINGIVMPIVGKFAFGVDFKALKYTLNPAVLGEKGEIVTPEVAIAYGEFISVVIDFFFVALFMFLLIKMINKLKKEAPPAEATAPSAEEKLLGEIRDLLKK